MNPLPWGSDDCNFMAGKVASVIATIMVVLMASLGDGLAEDYYVAPGGSDANPGTREKPFQTMHRARDMVRRSSGLRKQPVSVYLRKGTYYLAAAVSFTPDDSGTSNAPVTYAAYKGEKVVISGGSRLELNWKAYREGVLQAKTPDGLECDQFFVDGMRQPMARYPNFDPDVLPYNGFAEDAFSRERAARWVDPVGGYIHAMHAQHWGGFDYRITGKDAGGKVTYEGGWQNNRPSGMHRSHRFVENIFEELDAPGEWFHNRKTRTLYYYPPRGVDVRSANCEISRLKRLVEFSGSREAPVRHIRLAGLIFRHAERTFMETRDPLLRSDWTIYRGGAVTFTGAEDCLIADCEFDQVGGNAVFVDNYNRRIVVRCTHIHGAGASGVCFVGDPKSVRNPLFGYQQRQSYVGIDKTPGPRTDNYPADCVVEDCLIHNVGVVEKQAAGVQISMSRGITVRSCSVYDVGRAGINISEGTFGGHMIEFCDVFDTVRETGDHGSFNSWGRDRFWGLKDTPLARLPETALLDAEKTIIRNNRWRCDHGWDVDLDDGSSNYEIYNNLFLHGGLKLREGFHRLVYNNIAVNSTLHPHVWYPDSKDVLRNNIWMSDYPKPVGMPEGKWGDQNDCNLLPSEAALGKANAKGWDMHSIVGDPMFVDPANGDYRVKDESPALRIGFKNFTMDKFGVQKPELKAIARVPAFPTPQTAARVSVPTEAPAESWLGATVRALTGEEYSAFGVAKEDGGLHLVAVPPESHAAKAGLREGDLVQSISGKAVKTLADLRTAGARNGGKPLDVGLVRRQKHLILKIGL